MWWIWLWLTSSWACDPECVNGDAYVVETVSPTPTPAAIQVVCETGGQTSTVTWEQSFEVSLNDCDACMVLDGAPDVDHSIGVDFGTLVVQASATGGPPPSGASLLTVDVTRAWWVEGEPDGAKSAFAQKQQTIGQNATLPLTWSRQLGGLTPDEVFDGLISAYADSPDPGGLTVELVMKVTLDVRCERTQAGTRTLTITPTAPAPFLLDDNNLDVDEAKVLQRDVDLCDTLLPFDVGPVISEDGMPVAPDVVHMAPFITSEATPPDCTYAAPGAPNPCSATGEYGCFTCTQPAPGVEVRHHTEHFGVDFVADGQNLPLIFQSPTDGYLTHFSPYVYQPGQVVQHGFEFTSLGACAKVAWGIETTKAEPNGCASEAACDAAIENQRGAYNIGPDVEDWLEEYRLWTIGERWWRPRPFPLDETVALGGELLVQYPGFSHIHVSTMSLVGGGLSTKICPAEVFDTNVVADWTPLLEKWTGEPWDSVCPL